MISERDVERRLWSSATFQSKGGGSRSSRLPALTFAAEDRMQLENQSRSGTFSRDEQFAQLLSH